jgi:hypothetical protein
VHNDIFYNISLDPKFNRGLVQSDGSFDFLNVQWLNSLPYLPNYITSYQCRVVI